MERSEIRIETEKTVNFIEVLEVLREKECRELSITYHPSGVHYLLPDGRENIKNRLWDMIAKTRFGNQVFNNDSYYRYIFPTFNGEPFANDDEKALYELVKPALNGNESILFWVCW